MGVVIFIVNQPPLLMKIHLNVFIELRLITVLSHSPKKMKAMLPCMKLFLGLNVVGNILNNVEMLKCFMFYH